MTRLDLLRSEPRTCQQPSGSMHLDSDSIYFGHKAVPIFGYVQAEVCNMQRNASEGNPLPEGSMRPHSLPLEAWRQWHSTVCMQS